MTVVAVHGVPETAAVWDELCPLLEPQIGPILRLSPPGFGAALPADAAPSPAMYVEWLLDELATIDGPIDLLGHDWGAGHVGGAVAAAPGAMGSWAVACGGLFAADYVWHDTAQTWQTPGAGEEALAATVAIPTADLAGAYGGLGVTPAIATSFAEAMTDDMARAILGLYRGGAQPFLRDLGDRLAAADRPRGLLINATGDPYVPSAGSTLVAARLGVEELMLPDAGHWWAVTHADAAATGLLAFWASLD